MWLLKGIKQKGFLKMGMDVCSRVTDGVFGIAELLERVLFWTSGFEAMVDGG